VGRLRRVSGSAAKADDLRRRLEELAQRYSVKAAVVDQRLLERDLGRRWVFRPGVGGFCLQSRLGRPTTGHILRRVARWVPTVGLVL